jgi:hypothetical protein
MRLADYEAFTIVLWAKVDGQTVADGEALISFGSDSYNRGMIGIYYWGNPPTHIAFVAGGGLDAWAAVDPIPDGCVGQWAHYALVYSNGVLTGLVNGKPVVTKTGVTADQFGNSSGLGTHWWLEYSACSTRFVGGLDEVRIYNRALTSNEVEGLFLQDRPGTVSMPVVDITTTNSWMEYPVSTVEVSGTNNTHVVGLMSWSNNVGATGVFPAMGAWTASVVGVMVGTNYVTVTGTNAAGERSCDTVWVVREFAPVGLTATIEALDRVRLRWADRASGVEQLRIERRTMANAAWTVVGVVPPPVTNFVSVGLASGTRYEFRVTAMVRGLPAMTSESVWVEMARLPGMPRNLTAVSGGTNRIHLTWIDGSENETGFELQRRSGGIGVWGRAASLGADATTWTDSGLRPNSPYHYRIRATNAVGVSAFTPEASTMTDPEPAPPEGMYVLRVVVTNLMFDGVATNPPVTVRDRSLVGGTMDVVHTVPRGVATSMRVAMGFRDAAGRVCGVPQEVRDLYGAVSWQDYVLHGVRVPDGLATPQDAGAYGLWIESHPTLRDPSLDFAATVRTNETALAKCLGPVMVTPAPHSQVEVRLLSAMTTVGRDVDVPVLVGSDGGEAVVAFTVQYDPDLLCAAGARLGDTVRQAELVTNANEVGRLGVMVMMPDGEAMKSGTKQAVILSWQTVQAGTATVSFADGPVSREVVFKDPLVVPDVTWVPGRVRIGGAGYEADVAPDGAPDGRVDIADIRRLSMMAAGLVRPTDAAEFQRADCSPRVTLGDGRINAQDYQQARRYASGANALVAAGGPTGPQAGNRFSAAAGITPTVKMQGDDERVLEVVSQMTDGTAPFWLPIRLHAVADEVVLTWSLSFDPAQLSFLDVRTVGAATNASVLTVPTELSEGRIGLMVAMAEGFSFPAGDQTVLELAFSVVPGAGAATSAVSFVESPSPLSIVDSEANVLTTSYSNGVVAILPVLAPFAPSAPVGLAAATVATNEISLTWTNTATDADGYRVHRKYGTEAWSPIRDLATNEESYADAGLARDTEYAYRLEVLNAAGSAWSEVVTGRTWSAIENWRVERMGAPDNVGSLEDGADADEDDILNLVEYALGLDPMATNDVGAVMNVRVRDAITIAGEAYGTLTYDLCPGAGSDVEVVVEVCTVLTQGAWVQQMIPVREEVVGGVTRVWLRSPTSVKDQQAEYYRLRVTRP